MPKFAANLNFFYGDVPFLERFAAARRDGFNAVEFVSPYEVEPAVVRKAMDDNKLKTVLFNAAIGSWDAGDRGLTVIGSREEEFRTLVDKVVPYAKELDCPRVNVMAGLHTELSEDKDVTWKRFVERLRYAADTLGKHGITVVLEHINTIDMPDYYIATPAMALQAVKEVGRDNCLIQYDMYHAQRMAGEVTGFLRANFKLIGHIQIADNPNRNQPGTGEMNYKFLLDELDRLGYAGWVGLEYKPTPNPAASLAWVKEMGFTL